VENSVASRRPPHGRQPARRAQHRGDVGLRRRREPPAVRPLYRLSERRFRRSRV